jgi:hypothetical protein
VLPSGGPGDGAEGRGARLVRLPQLNRSPFHGDTATDASRQRLSWWCACMLVVGISSDWRDAERVFMLRYAGDKMFLRRREILEVFPREMPRWREEGRDSPHKVHMQCGPELGRSWSRRSPIYTDQVVRYGPAWSAYFVFSFFCLLFPSSS